MSLLHKDILRYVIFLVVTIIAVVDTYCTTSFIMGNYELVEGEALAALVTVNSTLVGAWVYWIKQFAQTKAGSNE